MTDEKARRFKDCVDFPLLNRSYVRFDQGKRIKFLTHPWSDHGYEVPDIDGVTKQVAELADGSRSTDELLATFDPSQRETAGAVAWELYTCGLLLDATDPVEWTQHSALRGERTEADQFSVRMVGESQLTTILQETMSGDLFDVKVTDTGSQSVTSVTDRFMDSDVIVYAPQTYDDEVAVALTRYALETDRPFVQAFTLGSRGVIGPTVTPDSYGCTECFLKRARSGIGDALAPTDGGRAFLPMTLILSGYLCLELCSVLFHRQGYLVSRVLTFDAYDFTVDLGDVLLHPDCETCSEWDGSFVTLEEVIRDF